MNIKELFESAENGVMSYDQFEAAAKSRNAKFIDLSEGTYVSKNKYDSDVMSRDERINLLNDTISTRDADLADIKKRLETAGSDAEAKLATLTNDFTDLQNKYAEDTKNYEDRLNKQAYEFAVREFAGGIKFTSQAAKREFMRAMIDQNLEMEDGEIIGADDFVDDYIDDNQDSFVIDEEEFEDDFGYEDAALPAFVAPTSGGSQPTDSNGFAEAFHFTGVRPIPND